MRCLSLRLLSCIGLVAFLLFDPRIAQAPGFPGAVVVFTGDSARIPAGVALSRSFGLPVFVTSLGANPEESVFLPDVDADVDLTIDCSARSTFGNAIVSSAWLKARGVGSFFLVTTDWHVPRAATVMRMVLSGAHVIPYGVPHAHGWRDPRERWEFLAMRVVARMPFVSHLIGLMPSYAGDDSCHVMYVSVKGGQ